MVTLFINEGCWACEQAQQFLIGQRVEYINYRIGVDVLPEDVLHSYPQAASETGIHGIKVPFAVRGNEIIGDYFALRDFILRLSR